MNDATLMKTVRSRLGLNQSDMAELCGYGDQARISDIECAKHPMSGPARKLLEKLYEETQ